MSVDDYNLVFQEVVPLNISLPSRRKNRVLKKIPLRFQEVIEVTTKSPAPKIVGMKSSHNDAPLKPFINLKDVPDIQEVREIKRYSLAELEQQFPRIFQDPINNRVDSRFQETFEINKMKTKYTPSQLISRARPVFPI